MSCENNDLKKPHVGKKQIPTCKLFNEKNWYSITLNPPDSKQFYKTPVGREFTFLTYWHDQLYKLKTYARFELYVEVSLRGRLHFHGLIQSKDTLNFHLYGVKLLESFGVYEIDTISDMDHWKKYYMKDQKYWLKRLKSFKKTYPFNSKTMVIE